MTCISQIEINPHLFHYEISEPFILMNCLGKKAQSVGNRIQDSLLVKINSRCRMGTIIE